ncbi:MAG TPA: efflux RND transporter periplasmic adaptor subunit [Rudaea sp.]|nr:efflux RND transporter periplasmic adaptor subunit [Rudaea sp.]
MAHPQADSVVNADVYSGDVHARFESQLGFRVAGKIKTRLVDVGNHVEAGQPLAELDPLDLKLQVASATATATSARANRDLAQSEFNRYQSLLEKHYISRTQFDTQVNTLKAAEAQVQQADAALSVARNQAEYTTLRADHAGAITAINAEAGQVVTAGQSIATLARDGSIEVEIAVPENRISHYRVGSSAVIEPWADSGKRLDATLREIAPEADAMTRTYRVRVALDATADTLRLGQTARVYFVGPKAAEQTVIPLTALDQRDGNANVWIVDTHTHQVHAAPVSIATYREQDAVIGKGIGAETWIVTAGVHKLREGQVVAPIDGVNRPVKI